MFNATIDTAFSYDNAQSVQCKVNYIKSFGLGGAYVWAVKGRSWMLFHSPISTFLRDLSITTTDPAGTRSSIVSSFKPIITNRNWPGSKRFRTTAGTPSSSALSATNRVVTKLTLF
jgi:GH18 family chitinase